MIKIQGTVLEIFANKMVTTNLGHPVHVVVFVLFFKFNFKWYKLKGSRYRQFSGIQGI